MVWTLTGKRAIEKIKIGDSVLAQDVESGELAYKPVLGVTAPSSRDPRCGLSLGDEVCRSPRPVILSGWRARGWRDDQAIRRRAIACTRLQAM